LEVAVKRVLVFAIVVCFASVGMAQAPSVTASGYEQLQLLLRLDVLGKQLVQDGRDMNEMAGPFTRDCELFHELMNLSEQADVASSHALAVEDMLEMYSLISTPKDTMAAGKVLTKHIDNSKQALESAIKSVNLSLSTSSMPAGVAVTGTRLRDDIRSEIELFDKLKPR
jgi:hypothetical protein